MRSPLWKNEKSSCRSARHLEAATDDRRGYQTKAVLAVVLHSLTAVAMTNRCMSVATVDFDTESSIKQASPEDRTTWSLRHGTQFGVPMRKELVKVCVGMRGDAGQVK